MKRTLSLLLLAGAAIVHAQGSMRAPLVLQLPAGARSLSLGNVGVAIRDDESIFYNPAQLQTVRGSSFSAQRYRDGSASGAMSTAFAFGPGGVGLGVQWLGYTTPDHTLPQRVTRVDSTGDMSASSVAMTLGVGSLLKGFRTGVGVKLAHESVERFQATRGLVDVGVSKDFQNFLAWGVSIQNITTRRVDESNLPTRVTVGAQGTAPLVFLLPVSPFIDFGLAGQVSVLSDGWVKPAGGVELGYAWIEGWGLVLRGGGRRPEPGEGAWTAGAGLNADRLRLDYAIESREGGAIAHRVGVRIR